MYYRRKDNELFSKGHLSAVLDQTLKKIESYANGLSYESLSGDEESIKAEIIEQYRLKSPVLIEDKKEISAKEADVEINNPDFRVFNEGPATFTKKGFIVTVVVPFEGDKDLFQYQPSTRSFSGKPEAQVHDNKLTFTIKTVSKNPEEIKKIWQTQLESIKEQLEWVKKDVDSYNNVVPGIIKKALAKRKSEADENQKVINALNQG